jgi:protein-S-isoprenylcysteine O-methyltransferase Ste14
VVEFAAVRPPLVNLILRSVVWAAAIVCWMSLRWIPGARWTDIPLRSSTILGLAATSVGIIAFVSAASAIARGVPNAIDPPAVLLRRGPFRYTRNPLYLAAAAIFAGTTTVYGLWEPHDVVVIGLVAAMVHAFVVYREEPATRRRLGPAYDDYCRRVPRWIPRLPTRGHPSSRAPS